MRAVAGDGDLSELGERVGQFRVGDATARVDRYLKDPEDSRAGIKRALASAMRFFSFAATAWSNFDARGDFGAVGRASAIGECPRLREAIERDAARWEFGANDPAFAGLIAGSEGLHDLWACAADKVDEAERLVAAQPRPVAVQ